MEGLKTEAYAISGVLFLEKLPVGRNIGFIRQLSH
jgi:hypothetical protein